jgi:hypothetical protein
MPNRTFLTGLVIPRKESREAEAKGIVRPFLMFPFDI